MMMANKKEEILRVEGLKQYFKTGFGRNRIFNKAVDDISFTVNKGEVFSLVGESGCGKTTTGRSIIKLYKSTGGEVFFHGKRIISDVSKAKDEHAKVMTTITAEKTASLDALNAQKDQQTISIEAYEIELKAIESRYNEQKEASLKLVKEAKRDQKFEKYISDEQKEKAANFQAQPRYQDILTHYDNENKSLLASISKLESKNELDKDEKEQLISLKKELKLNDLRQKQDFSNLKYALKHENKLLMRKMQMIFQDPIASLNPRMTVKEIIAEGLRINGVKNEAEIDRRVKESLETVGLVAEHASRYPHEFSGGQRQRIGIARALVVEPSFIIADEPISALDVSIRAHVINLLNELREQKGITILFIAHDLSVVKYFSDRLAVMYFGHIVEIGDKEKIFSHPLHPYTLSLMDSIPLPDPAYEKRRQKSSRYNPAEAHDYSMEQPTLREIEPDHFVLCNSEEFKRYQQQLKS
jgi:oligopeptide transport system ATP-binding protein